MMIDDIGIVALKLRRRGDTAYLRENVVSYMDGQFTNASWLYVFAAKLQS